VLESRAPKESLTMWSKLSRLIWFGLFLLGQARWGIAPSQAIAPLTVSPASVASTAEQVNDCRFGMTAVNNITNPAFNLPPLGLASYLNWNISANPKRPNNMDYVQLVRLRSDVYTYTLAEIPAVAQAQPGAYWLVGNEPDTTYGQGEWSQDKLTPRNYAIRYDAVYKAIKANDPTAKVGIGGIVQPTAVRMEYLNRVFEEYKARHSGALPPSDFWHIHAFILNEEQGEWGTGLPPDYLSKPYMPTVTAEVIDWDDNDSLPRFKQRLENFRAWMKANGQQAKPLWITEYGVLMPSDPEKYFVSISLTRTRDFMTGAFDYQLQHTDPDIGYPGDGGRLVQRNFWWTLSADSREIGGGLYELRTYSTSVTTTTTLITPTMLYTAYTNYIANLPHYTDLAWANVSITPTTGTVPFTATINLEVFNQGNLPVPGFDVALYQGRPPEMTLIDRATVTQTLYGCKSYKLTLQWPNINPAALASPADLPAVWLRFENVPANENGSSPNWLCASLTEPATSANCGLSLFMPLIRK